MKKFFQYCFKHKIKLVILVVLISGFTALYSSYTSDITPEERYYAKTRNRLLSLVNKKDPRIAMDELARLSSENELALRYCHSLVHEIGDASFARYHDVGEALVYSNDICGSGYIHGVIESYFEGVTDIPTALKTVCSKYAPGFESGNCYHGVGHGLMYNSDDDVPFSLKHCDLYTLMSTKISCSEGVFMENFNTDQLNHVSKYLDEKNPFSLCDAQSKPYFKGTCYFYAPLYYLNINQRKYSDAFAWCEKAEKDFVKICIKGASSRVTKENIKNISYAEKLCSDLDPKYAPACAEGIGSYYTTHYNDRESTRRMCMTLRKDFQGPCLKSAE